MNNPPRPDTTGGANPTGMRTATFEALRSLVGQSPLRFRIHGNCMDPWLGSGSRVKVAPRRLYWPGDILAFQAPDGRLLAHRLIGYSWTVDHGRPALCYVTQADQARGIDPPLAPERILGRVASRSQTQDVPWRHRLRACHRFATLVSRWTMRRANPFRNLHAGTPAMRKRPTA